MASQQPLVTELVKTLSISQQYKTNLFVQDQDIASPELSDVVAKILKVDLALMRLSDSQIGNFESLYLRRVTLPVLEKALVGIKAEAKALEPELLALCEDVPRIGADIKGYDPKKKKSLIALANNLKSLEALLVRQFLVPKRCERLEGRVLHQHYKDLREWHQNVTDYFGPFWKDYKNETKDLPNKVDLFDAVAKKIIKEIGEKNLAHANEKKKSIQRELKNLQAQACQFARQVALRLHTKIAQSKLELLAKNGLKGKLEGIEGTLLACLDQLKATMRAHYPREYVQLIAEKNLPKLDYVPPHASWINLWKIYEGWRYPKATEMQDAIDKIFGAVFAVKTRLEVCLQNLLEDPEAAIEQLKSLDAKLFFALQKELEETLGLLHTCERDRLLARADSGALVQATLDNMRHTRRWLERWLADDTSKKMIFLLHRVFQQLNPAEAVSALHPVEEFVYAAKELTRMRTQFMNQPLPIVSSPAKLLNQNFFNQWMLTSTTILHDTLATIGPEAMNITASEQAACDAIFGNQPLENLLAPTEALAVLPAVLRGYALKRMIYLGHLVHLYSEPRYDVQLELLFGILQTPKYINVWNWTLQNDKAFKDAYEGYNDSKLKRLSKLTDEQRKAASAIFLHVYNAERPELRSPFAYYQAYQALFEFSRAPTELTQNEPKKQLMELLVAKLQEAAKLHRYIRFTFSDNPTDTSEDLLPRALIALLLGKDNAEKPWAEAVVEEKLLKVPATSTLETLAFADTVADLKDLIHQNVFRNVARKTFDKIGPLQLRLFIEGPLTDYLYARTDRCDMRIRDAIISLMKHPLTAAATQDAMKSPPWNEYLYARFIED